VQIGTGCLSLFSTASGATLFTHDLLRRPATATDPRTGLATSFLYHATLGHRASVTGPGRAETVAFYDAATGARLGLARGRTSQGQTTYFDYDPLGRLTHTWGPATYPVRYDYDSQGRLWKLRTYGATAGNGRTGTFGTGSAWPTLDDGGHETSWEYYPGSPLLHRKVDATGQASTYTHHPHGALETRTWARPRPGGGPLVTTYSYTGAGELRTVSANDGSLPVVSTYSPTGLLQTRLDAAGLHTYAYADLLPRSDAITGTGVLSGLAVSQTVTAGRVTALNVGGVPALTHGFGYHPTTGRPESVTGAGLTATYGYLPQSDWLASTALTEGGTPRLLSTRTPDTANRLSSIAASHQSTSLESHTWTYYPVTGRRTRATLGTPQAPLDGSYWEYGYNDRSEVTSAARKLVSAAPVNGRSHSYTFDALGNRLTTTVNGRASTYSPTALNQSTQRTVPGGFDVLGEAATGATVSVNNQPTTRQAGLFSYSTTAANTLAPAYPTLSIAGATQNAGPNGEDAVTTATGKVFLARTPEVFTHDEDGNLTGDGRWTYTWDAENRLATMDTQPAAVTAGVTRVKLEFTYDARHRRIQKIVRSGWTGTAYTHTVTTRFLYDEGWNVLAEYEAVNTGPSALTRSYLWGTDLSGTRSGAGGVGGLLALRHHTGPQAGTYLALYDGNGNLTGLLQATTGTRAATCEYGPFGEPLRAAGAMAELNPFRFSTRYTDQETGLVMYPLRPYNPATGRWLSRDPIEEQGGFNLYGFVHNNPLHFFDFLGLEPVTIDFQTRIKTNLYGFTSGVKTSHVLTVETTNAQISGESKLLGTTWGVVQGRGNLMASASLTDARDDGGYTTTVTLTGYAFTGVRILPRIDYSLTITIESDCEGKVKKAPLKIGHDGFPTYQLNFKGRNVYNYQEGVILELFGVDDVSDNKQIFPSQWS